MRSIMHDIATYRSAYILSLAGRLIFVLTALFLVECHPVCAAEQASGNEPFRLTENRKAALSKKTVTLYATADLNYRSSPKMDDNIVGSIARGCALTCAEHPIGNWRRVYLNNHKHEDSDVYVCDAYLSPEAPEDDGDQSETDLLPGAGRDDCGTYGRILVPDLGISMAVDEGDSDLSAEELQAIVDLPDRALHFQYLDDVEAIADHNIDGFDVLYDASYGTEAYVLREDGTYDRLVCIRRDLHGRNTSDELLDDNGDRCPMYHCDVLLYTCNYSDDENDDGITITYWDWDR